MTLPDICWSSFGLGALVVVLVVVALIAIFDWLLGEVIDLHLKRRGEKP